MKIVLVSVPVNQAQRVRDLREQHEEEIKQQGEKARMVAEISATLQGIVKNRSFPAVPSPWLQHAERTGGVCWLVP
jgi:hypothetical protein